MERRAEKKNGTEEGREVWHVYREIKMRALEQEGFPGWTC